MSIAKHPLKTVTQTDLQRLVQEQVREDRTLEFKRQTYAGTDDARYEFLADISALANTMGGDVVLGLDEEQGTASSVVGLQAGLDVDQEILRLGQLAQAGLQPRLPSLELHAVPLDRGGNALVIRVGRSFLGPHRVILKGRNRFWVRADGRRYEPDVDELRSLFSAAPLIAARIREIRADRIASVLAGDTPVPLFNQRGMSILHIVPFSAATPTPKPARLEDIYESSALIPWGAAGCDFRRNFDGFVAFSNRTEGRSRAYLQVFRSGVVEVSGADLFFQSGSDTVSVDRLAFKLSQQVKQILPSLRTAELEPPYSVHLTLTGVSGASFNCEAPLRPIWRDEPDFRMKRDVLSLENCVIADTDSSGDDVVRALRPMLDQLYQAAGIAGCPWFAPDGTIRSPR